MPLLESQLLYSHTITDRNLNSDDWKYLVSLEIWLSVFIFRCDIVQLTKKMELLCLDFDIYQICDTNGIRGLDMRKIFRFQQDLLCQCETIRSIICAISNLIGL